MIALVILFVILMILLLVGIIFNTKINIVLKIIIIPLVIWYSLILYTIPNQFRGTPVDLNFEELNLKKIFVESIIVIEPSKKQKGGIYFWVIEYTKEEQKQMIINPFIFFKNNKKEPKSYKIPYSKSTYKKIIKALAQKKQSKGNQLVLKKAIDKNSGDNMAGDKEIELKIFNPYSVLIKD